MVQELPSAAWSRKSRHWTGSLVRWAAAATLTATSASAQIVPDFSLASLEFPMNSELQTAGIGDWDRDGFDDVLLGHTSQLRWMRSRGDGSFDAPAAIPGAMGAYGVRWLDLNGDGLLDVVEAAPTPMIVRVAYQLPGGTFAPSVTLATNARLEQIGDFDGDARPDLLVLNSLGGRLAVRTFFNKPTGWQASPRTSLGSSYTGLLADLNGDGNFDLVRFAMGSTMASFDLVIRYGTGPGTYSAPLSALSDVPYGNLRAVDVDADGIDELLYVTDKVYLLRILLGPIVSTELIAPGGRLLAEPADYDADGDIDLFFLFSTGSTLLLNDGLGGFAERVEVAADQSSSYTGFGDVNGDGAPDFARAAGNIVSLSISDGLGGWSKQLPTPVPRDYVLKAVGDLDGDGQVDFIGQKGGQGIWLVLRGLGNGTSSALAGISLPGYLTSCELRDVDGDGDLDAIGRALFAHEVVIALNDGTGGFPGPVVTTSGLEMDKTFFGDVNGDNKLDLVLSTPVLAVRLGDGTGAFGSSIPSLNYSVAIRAVGDLDGDGFDDAIDGANQMLRIRRGSATGVFGPAIFNAVPGVPVDAITLGDYNADGNLDAAWISLTSTAHIARAYGDGTAHFAAPVLTPIPWISSAPTLLQRVDLGPDGLDDLALLSQQGSSAALIRRIRLFESSPAGTLDELVSIPCSTADFAANFVADITGDARAEVLLAPESGITRGFTLLRR